MLRSHVSPLLTIVQFFIEIYEEHASYCFIDISLIFGSADEHPMVYELLSLKETQLMTSLINFCILMG